MIFRKRSRLTSDEIPAAAAAAKYWAQIAHMIPTVAKIHNRIMLFLMVLMLMLNL